MHLSAAPAPGGTARQSRSGLSHISCTTSLAVGQTFPAQRLHQRSEWTSEQSPPGGGGGGGGGWGGVLTKQHWLWTLGFALLCTSVGWTTDMASDGMRACQYAQRQGRHKHSPHSTPGRSRHSSALPLAAPLPPAQRDGEAEVGEVGLVHLLSRRRLWQGTEKQACKIHIVSHDSPTVDWVVRRWFVSQSLNRRLGLTRPRHTTCWCVQVHRPRNSLPVIYTPCNMVLDTSAKARPNCAMEPQLVLQSHLVAAFLGRRGQPAHLPRQLQQLMTAAAGAGPPRRRRRLPGVYSLQRQYPRGLRPAHAPYTAAVCRRVQRALCL